MHLISTVLLYAGTISLLIGYLGIVFCGFTDGIDRGLRNLIFPFLGFGDAMRRFHALLWLWAGGIGAIVVGALIG